MKERKSVWKELKIFEKVHANIRDVNNDCLSFFDVTVSAYTITITRDNGHKTLMYMGLF